MPNSLWKVAVIVVVAALVFGIVYLLRRDDEDAPDAEDEWTESDDD